ncbi:MAG: AI-2E family transporter [Candidatus Eisenbacteria sp.]|nr:AI-2E family transporter [Candidatus Eisenbacteria bacterium]
MSNEGGGRISSYVFFVVLIGLIYLCYLLFKPFLYSIIWAAVLVTLFRPVTVRLRSLLRGRETITAVLMCIIVVLIIVGPIVSLTIILVNEAQGTYVLINNWVDSGELRALLENVQDSPFVQRLLVEVGRHEADLEGLDIQSSVLASLKQVTGFIGSHSTRIIQGFSSSFVGFVLMIFAMFYFFRDGEKALDGLVALSPLAPDAASEAFRQFVEVSKATLYGGLVVAVVQGALGGIGFHFLGLPSPVLWGSVMALLSLIPVVGAAFVWLPAALILIAQGAWIKGIILIAYGSLIVGLADNVLKPLLIGERTGLHTLLIFFSILGGLKVFGFLGFVIGPVIIAVLISFARIFRMRYGPEESAEEAPNTKPTS